MKKSIFAILIFSFVLLCACCDWREERQRQNYGKLCSAAQFSASKITGSYQGEIPPDFDSDKFLVLARKNIPQDYFEELNKHHIEIKTINNDYLLKVFDSSNQLILFDYNCTPEVDGPILDDPEKYDITNLEKYYICTK